MTDPMARARGALFDLDGVLVDTARHHYLAWRRLAAELGFAFTATDNERLKGVSRARSLEILLELGGITAGEALKREWMERKNAWYVEQIAGLTPADLLPGARDYLLQLRWRGKRVALGSASRNAPLILERLDIAGLFDAVVDGNKVAQAKPDPEVFLCAAAELGLAPADCVVFEDSVAGLIAARRAGMRVVGIGEPAVLGEADLVVSGLHLLGEKPVPAGE